MALNQRPQFLHRLRLGKFAEQDYVISNQKYSKGEPFINQNIQKNIGEQHL
jgi:hypothetical protein